MKKFFSLVFLFLLFLFSGISASASTFHESLPENRREEISIIDEYTVKVGLGPDQRSVSCNILDAVGSIPSINGTTEPDVVYVNKEKVHHISKGLYTWDRAGKYRVRLTTKYIREFGDITIRVPNEAAAGESIPEKMEEAHRVPSYYQNLPEDKREEITIIDPYMVEVGMGSDLRTVASNIQDAIQSIPTVEEDRFPEFVNVNGRPIFFIGNGLYSWDSEGNDPVRLTTRFIKKYGNIKVSIVPLDSPATPPKKINKQLSEKASMEKKSPSTTTSVPVKKDVVVLTPDPVKKIEGAFSLPKEEDITTSSKKVKVAKIQPQVSNRQQAKPASPAPVKKKGLGLKGFRKAQFGMDMQQVKQVIREDFKLDDSQIKTFGREKNILAISTDKLSESGESASVQYYFSNDKLARVNVLWGPSENTDQLAAKLVQQFLSLRFLEKQSPENRDAQLYYGKDSQGNELKLSWANSPDGNSRPLSLSYLAFNP
ncbi:MAG: hypothetical protein VW455_09730 [Nitrospinota bacterium]